MAFIGTITDARLEPDFRTPWLDFENCEPAQGKARPARNAINQCVLRMISSVGAASSPAPLGAKKATLLRASGWATWVGIEDANIYGHFADDAWRHQYLQSLKRTVAASVGLNHLLPASSPPISPAPLPPASPVQEGLDLLPATDGRRTAALQPPERKRCPSPAAQTTTAYPEKNRTDDTSTAPTREQPGSTHACSLVRTVP